MKTIEVMQRKPTEDDKEAIEEVLYAMMKTTIDAWKEQPVPDDEALRDILNLKANAARVYLQRLAAETGLSFSVSVVSMGKSIPVRAVTMLAIRHDGQRTYAYKIVVKYKFVTSAKPVFVGVEEKDPIYTSERKPSARMNTGALRHRGRDVWDVMNNRISRLEGGYNDCE